MYCLKCIGLALIVISNSPTQVTFLTQLISMLIICTFSIIYVENCTAWEGTAPAQERDCFQDCYLYVFCNLQGSQALVTADKLFRQLSL